jgi:hypothetical protein
MGFFSPRGWGRALLPAAAVLGVAAVAAAQTVWDGTADVSWYSDYDTTGTEFTITTAEQLAGFARLVNNGEYKSRKNIKLGNNIALNDTANWERWADSAPANKWTPIDGGSNWNFSGTFDGAGFAIRGVYVSISKEDDENLYAGLFGGHYGTIKNLGVVASYVKGGERGGSVGGLAGNVRDGEITNCYASVNVVGGGASVVGGLVGEIYHSKITNSYVTGNVTVEGEGVTVGGFVGGSNEGYVENSYTTVNVVNVSGDVRWTHGFVGGGRGVSFKRCYYRDDANSLSTYTYGGDPKTTEEMKQQSTYIGWDFDSVWVMSEYPILRVQQMPPTVAVSSPARVIPAANPGATASVAPVSALTAEFAAGPNPAGKSSGGVTFYWSGAAIKGASLYVCDASGSLVRRVGISDKPGAGKRSVGSWDLRDASGRTVPAGSYLARVTVTKKDGKKERVSAIVGVR